MRVLLLAAILVAGCRPGPVPAALQAVTATGDGKPMSGPFVDRHIPPRTPSPAGKAPVLVLVHGYGSNEDDLLALARTLDPRLDLHGLRAPIALRSGSFAWFNVTFTTDGPVHTPAEAETARRQLADFLKRLRSEPSVDASRFYLLGFSQGAILGLSLAFTEPSLLAGVIAISGRTLPEVAATVSGKAMTGGPRVLLMHGTADERLPFVNALATEQRLKSAGFTCDFKSYPVGHTIDARMRDDVAAWLSARLGP